MDEGLININVIVADRPYPLKVRPDEEENVRKAAKSINDKIKEFRQLYAAKDKQDYLAMTALVMAVENLNSDSSKHEQSQALNEKLEELDELLNDLD